MYVTRNLTNSFHRILIFLFEMDEMIFFLKKKLRNEKFYVIVDHRITAIKRYSPDGLRVNRKRATRVIHTFQHYLYDIYLIRFIDVLFCFPELVYEVRPIFLFFICFVYPFSWSTSRFLQRELQKQFPIPFCRSDELVELAISIFQTNATHSRNISK